MLDRVFLDRGLMIKEKIESVLGKEDSDQTALKKALGDQPTKSLFE